MSIDAPHDVPDPDDESASERALFTLRATRLRWSVEAIEPSPVASPFSTGAPSTDDDGPLFAT